MPLNKSEFLRGLGIEHPIVQAPMSGGATTPELVAAACNAGVLGSFGAGYLTGDQIASDIRRIRSLTDKPFNVNLFAGGYASETRVDAAPMLAVLAEAHEALGLPAPTLPPWPPNTFNEQLEAVLEAQPAVFSFTFGIPDADAMARIKARGILTVGTATTAEEGRGLQESGVTAIAAQGAEAGGHRGTFAGAFETSMFPTMELVQGLLKVVSVPVIASGGLMDGRDIANFLARGADAAQLGSAFLPCPEAGTSESYKRAMLAARTDTTVITRAFSGRPARGLANAFTARFTGSEEIILPFPLQNALTRPMRNAAAKLGESGFQSLFCGQGVARARALPVAELVNRLVSEMNSTRIASA
ncbi:MAG TPA: nitronate monooxygenase [Candidatus Acidoferrales bacterium]|nr:nitronate monooxygenase [Candidatus Acidoferrales bacterium]